ncbi:MAG: YiiX/YebB-like N1pC/P60 family cysteine hydrolase [Lutibacter sp.]|uniref:YiiX/YebB-like N1pC/P60 family cysteine hydrolase n=1 Tax=Lutibacter sp. TaxID=1925666 RepID=UPI00299D2702|nr:YiiX/YebB-like N1pC/P60 family cysteine hydrolase [Lutibacter sp.]MDX1829118.1 YiiX/YebB-like N1pC/P60 family cysteine hydrolase [Lutibacter sp.]
MQKNISEKIQNGDLILRCGHSIESYTVLLADSSATFSHIGIISIENHIPYVIHAVPWKINTIKKEKLNDFINLKVASTYAVYRTNYNPAILKNVVNQANLFYQKKYTFDNEYDLTTNTKLYCTELILKAFRNAGINLKIKTKSFNYLVGKHNLIFPSEFTKSPFKKII